MLNSNFNKSTVKSRLVAGKNITLLLAILFAAGLNSSWAQVTWTQKTNFAGDVRRVAVGIAIRGKSYIGTGYDGSKAKRDFWEYDPSNDAWTQKAKFKGISRDNAVGFSIGGKGYIGTGEDYPQIYKDFWEYDPSNNA